MGPRRVFTGTTRRGTPSPVQGMGRPLALFLISMVVVLIADPAAGRAAIQDVSAKETVTVCSSTQNGYTVQLCLTAPLPRQPITDVAAISATVEVSDPAIKPLSVDFELSGRNILSDFDPSYAFELPASYFADGEYTLSATARLSDKSRTNPVASNITLFTGSTSSITAVSDFEPRTGRPATEGEPFVLAAVGDSAGGSGQSAAVTDLIASWDPNMFLYLGDVYNAGAPLEFYNWYAPDTFLGRFRDITNPTVGNHEWSGDKGPAGYLQYWGNPPHYYSVDTAGWHIVNLDTNTKFNETDSETPQVQWLVDDLESADASCTMVFFHHPVFSVGTHGDTEELAELWKILVEHNVTVVLTAHDHNYQRWLPLNASSEVDDAGTTTLVIGTGGQSEYSSQRKDERLAGPFLLDPGALRMELNPNGAAMQFITTDGIVRDSNVVSCDRSNEAADTASPTAPGKPTAVREGDGTVALHWPPAVDDIGIAAYDIYRNDVLIGSVAPGVNFVDAGVSASPIASYRVVARDSADNQSASSPSAAVIPGHDASIVFADSFGSASLQRWTTVNGLAIESSANEGEKPGWMARARGGRQPAFARIVLPRPVIPPQDIDLTVTLDFRVRSQGPNTVALLRLLSRESNSLVGVSLNAGGELSVRNDAADSGLGSSVVVTQEDWHQLTVRISGPRDSPRIDVQLDDSNVAELSGAIDLRGVLIDKVQLGDSTVDRVYDVQYREITIAAADTTASSGSTNDGGTIAPVIGTTLALLAPKVSTTQIGTAMLAGAIPWGAGRHRPRLRSAVNRHPPPP